MVSTTSSFLLNQDENGNHETFQNKKCRLDIFYKIFGKKDNEFGIQDPNFSNNFMDRIEKKCEKGSRYI